MKLEGGSLDENDKTIDDIFPQTIRRFTRYNVENENKMDEIEGQSSFNKSEMSPQE